MPRPCCNPCSVSQYLVEFRSAQQPFPSSLLECVPKRRQHWEKLIKLEMVLLLSRFSHVQLCVTPWTIAREAPLSMEFSRQEFWSGFAMPSSRESSQPRDRTWVSCSAGRFFPTESPRISVYKAKLMAKWTPSNMNAHVAHSVLCFTSPSVCLAGLSGSAGYN